MKLKLMLVALAVAGLAACGNESATESKAPAVSMAPAQPAQAAAPAEQQKLADAKEDAKEDVKEEAKEEGQDPKDPTEQQEEKK